MELPLVVQNLNRDGIGNIMKSFVSALSVDSRSTVKPNLCLHNSLYHTVLDDKHIYKSGDYTVLGTFRFLVLKEEEDEQPNIDIEYSDIQTCGNPKFSNKSAIDMNYDPDKVCTRVKNRLLTIIKSIVFRRQIHTWVDCWISHINPSTTLGISVRTWKASHEQGICRSYDPETYKNAITTSITPETTHVLLSVDNPSYSAEYVSFLSKFPVKVVLLTQSPDQNNTQFAFVKMLALSKCAAVVGNRISTFTELIFWFGDCKPKVTTVF